MYPGARAVVTFSIIAVATTALAAELVVFESKTCAYCISFNSQAAPRYRASPEARRAPLRVVDIERPMPSDLKGIAPPWGTPTFVVVANGREIGRIAGYEGDERFYASLDDLLEKIRSTGR